MLKDFGIKPSETILAISAGGGSWQWDDTYLKEHIELSNQAKTFKKLTSSGWFPVFGNKTFDKGKHQWSIQIDAYPCGDFSGFSCGITLDEKMEYIVGNR